MRFLVDVLKQNSTFRALEKAVKNGRSLYASGLSSVNKANVIYALCRLKKTAALCIASDEKESQQLCNDLSSMGLRAFVYPVRDLNFLDFQSKSREYEHARLKVLLKLIEGECDVVISCIDAASQLTVPKKVLEESTLVFEEGKEVPLEKAVKTLTLLGYERFDAVEGSGQFSLRGGILDFFMPDSEYPVRAEFWGDEISDLNYFDIESQRRFKKAGKIKLSPSTEILVEDRNALAAEIERRAGLLRGKAAPKAKEKLYSEAELIRSGAAISNADKFINQIYEKPESLFDYFGRDALFFTSEFANVSDRGRSMDFQNTEMLKQAFEDGTLCKGFDRYTLTFNECIDIFTRHGVIMLENFMHGNIPIKLNEAFAFTAKQLSPWGGSYNQLKEDIDAVFGADSAVVVLAGTDKSAKTSVKI